MLGRTGTNKKIILNCGKLETRFAMLNNERLEAYHLERDSDMPEPGSIYLGKIINLQPSLQAAFIDIGVGKNAFLHYWDLLEYGEDSYECIASTISENDSEQGNKRKSKKKKNNLASQLLEKENTRRKSKMTIQDIPELFKPGTQLLVQVSKGPIGTKGARVTTNLSIPGRYLVLLPYSSHLALSTKIEEKAERERLRNVLKALDVPSGMGLICRTAGEGQKSVYFKHDLKLLLEYWDQLIAAVDASTGPGIVYQEPTLIERTVRDFMTEEINEIVVDDQDSFNKIYSMVKKVGGAKIATKVTHYKQAKPIFDTYKVSDQLKLVFNRQVPLPSGGCICIDETEALIAIDVNTGHGKRQGENNEVIVQTNLEAAAEIARQLRLRNIGGLVVIDFIDMRNSRDRDELFKTMNRLVKEDRAKIKILPLSKLGLMEMTRQREHESINDTVFDSCPYCHGTGSIKSPISMSVEIQRALLGILKNKRLKISAIRVVMHPDVLARLKNEDAHILCELEEKYGNNLSFRSDAALHHEAFNVMDTASGEVIYSIHK